MSFSQKQRPRLGIWIHKKCFKCFSTLFLMLYNIHFLKIWLTIVGAILAFFQKVAGPLLQRSLLWRTMAIKDVTLIQRINTADRKRE